MSGKLRLGISACLLGEKVRYDGQHKLDPFLRDTLGKYVEYVPVCPEVECGLGVPREAMRLVGSVQSPRLMTQRTGVDMTGKMLSWAASRLQELAGDDLCGFVFKSRSPSSGMERVKIYTENGGVAGRGPGLFAREFMKRFPLLPAEDEGRLQDPDLRENFIERIFALRRYRDAIRDGATLAALMAYHEHQKFLITAHSPAMARQMGKLLAESPRRAAARTAAEYEAQLLKALAAPATPSRHVNVLQHVMGFLKEMLTADEKQEMLELIDRYRCQLVPLVVPVTLINHYVRKHKIAYLEGQCYLNPHPVELKLRNHA